MGTPEPFDGLSDRELHDRATHLAWSRLDVGFLLDLLGAIPEARAAAGDLARSEADIMRPLALLNHLVGADEGDLARMLRPLYLDYLHRHHVEGPDGD